MSADSIRRAHRQTLGRVGVSDPDPPRLRQQHHIERRRLADVIDVLLVSDAGDVDMGTLEWFAMFVQRVLHPSVPGANSVLMQDLAFAGSGSLQTSNPKVLVFVPKGYQVWA